MRCQHGQDCDASDYGRDHPAGRHSVPAAPPSSAHRASSDSRARMRRSSARAAVTCRSSSRRSRAGMTGRGCTIALSFVIDCLSLWRADSRRWHSAGARGPALCARLDPAATRVVPSVAGAVTPQTGLVGAPLGVLATVLPTAHGHLLSAALGGGYSASGTSVSATASRDQPGIVHMPRILRGLR